MSRIRDIANLFSANTSAATDSEVTAAISAHNSSTTTVHGITDTSALATSTSVTSAISTHNTAANGHTGRGTTGNRPASPTIGDLYFDTTLAALISYTSTGWVKVSQDPAPQIASISPGTAATTGTTITITGSNFKSGLSVQFIGTNSTSYNSPVATFVGASTATATTPALSVAYEPYDVKVINSDNQFAILENCLDAGGTPAWSTSSGTIATITEQTALNVSVSATDPDGTSIVYSSSNLPAWISLNSSTGALTGTSPDISVDTTYSFDITASDGLNTSSRSFNVISITQVTSGLVYYLDAGKTSSYSGSGSTWTDISGSGKTSTLYNSPAFTSSGSSSYFRFNGSSHYAEGDASGLISGLSEATCNIWYRPLSSDNDGMIYDHHNYSSAGTRDNFSIRQMWAGGNTAGYRSDSNGNFASVLFENSNSNLNTWRNYTQVVRSNVMYSYVNGSLVNSVAVAGVIRTTSLLRIGQDAINSNYLTADFAVMQTFNRGLSDAEVLSNFNFFKSRYGY
jgi:hypothetical protein